MSKELTPLECVEYIRKQAYGNWLDDELDIIETALKDYEKKTKLAKEYADVDNVAKRLKALEIIKNKMVNVCAFISWVNLVKFTYERYLKIQLDYLVSAKTLTEEEFDLLKEVLK